ncbi:NADH-quinone oxidoreductase subunit M [Candidatus Entotheonellaceae bacterium PAL068K]
MEFTIAHALNGTPVLSVLTYTPIIGAILLMLFVPRQDTRMIKSIAIIFSLLAFVFALVVLNNFDGGTAKMQLVEHASWIPSLGVSYCLGVDGISILLILLTTLISVVSVLCSLGEIEDRQKEYYVCLLFLETGMLGVFVALDFFLFYIFWEVMLVPMYFLIGIWGHGRRLYSAIKFFLYTLFGSVFMLLGILGLYFLNGNPEYGTGELTFNVLTLITKLHVPTDPVFAGLTMQDLIFLSLFLGFAIKVPMFPFHTWLPDAHTDAPTAGSVVLAGVLLKMGTYGFVRFSLPLLPIASHVMVGFIAILAIIGIIYGALVAMAQTDMKRLIAYSSVSHMGFLMLGIFALNPEGVSGALLQMINHGISTGALFLLVGIIYIRRHTREIKQFSGLSTTVPVFAVFFAITMFSSIGLPGLNGFVGEFLILIGMFAKSKVYAALAVTGIILGAAYMLWLYQRTMFGEPTTPENQNMRDMNGLEVVYMLPLIILMFWIGLYPQPFLKRIQPTVDHYVSQMQEQQQAYLEAIERSERQAHATSLPRLAQTEGR